MRPSEDNFAASQIRRERWLVELIPVWRSFAGECSRGKGPHARAVIGWAASVDTSHDIRDRSIRSVSSPTETETADCDLFESRQNVWAERARPLPLLLRNAHHSFVGNHYRQ